MADINMKIEQLFNAFSSSKSDQIKSSMTTQKQLPTMTTASLLEPMPLSTLNFHVPSQSLQSVTNNRIENLGSNGTNMVSSENTIASDILSLLHSKNFEPKKPTFFSSPKSIDVESLFCSLNNDCTVSKPVSSDPIYRPNGLSQVNQMAETLESVENNISTFISPKSSNCKNILTNNTQTNSIAIPNNNTPQNNMSQCLKSYLNEQSNIQFQNKCQQEQAVGKNCIDDLLVMNDIIGGNNCNIGTVGPAENFISSSLSSNSSDSSQFSPPSTLVNDITQETGTFEQTDFIKSLPIPLDVLDDLASRFILNMVPEEKNDPIRICFQMEIAYWHYLDFCCECNDKLPKFKFKRFAQIMFSYVPRLRQFLHDFDDIVNQWVKYKINIPCSGAIMLDETMDYVLLVQGYGSKTWGFPKGKINHDEPLMNCAIREVFEETGYDCVANIHETQYLERKIFESRLRLYLIKDVSFDFDFKPQARNEIRSIKWFALKEFPSSNQHQQDQQKKSVTNGVGMPQNASKFVSVIPFVNAIRKWVENEKRKAKLMKKRERRQQQRVLKQEQQMIMNRAGLNIQQGDSKPFLLQNVGSNSSSPSTVEDECSINNDSSKITAYDPAESDTSFVDVDLKEILGFKEMYNVENDERELLTREQIYDNAFRESDRKNFQSTWNSLVSDYNLGMKDNNFVLNQNPNRTSVSSDKVPNRPISTSFVPKAGTLEDIERAMMDSVNYEPDSNATDVDSVLRSAKASCNEKLNLLFGLAKSTNSNCTTNNEAKVSSPQKLSNGSFNVSSKPLPAPIGTERNSSFEGHRSHNINHQKNDNQKCSGQTVISNNNSSNYDDAQNIEEFKLNTNPFQSSSMNLVPPKSNMNKSNALVENSKLEASFKQNRTTPGSVESTVKTKQINYNGLDDGTLSTVHPKIELLLQRLKVINNMA